MIQGDQTGLKSTDHPGTIFWYTKTPCLESPKPWLFCNVRTTLSCAYGRKVDVAYACTVNLKNTEHTTNRARVDNDFTLHVLTWRSNRDSNLIAGFKHQPHVILCHFIVSVMYSFSPHTVSAAFIVIFIYRYIELLYPFWHKAHFKMNYIYIFLAACWILGIGSNVAYKIPTSKVSRSNL